MVVVSSLSDEGSDLFRHSSKIRYCDFGVAAKLGLESDSFNFPTLSVRKDPIRDHRHHVCFGQADENRGAQIQIADGVVMQQNSNTPLE